MRSIDHLRARLGWHAESDENPSIEPLTPAAVASLRLPWLSRFNFSTLEEHVLLNPEMGFWVPATHEYIVAEQWRRRDDIANIIEITARKGREALLVHLLGHLRRQGCQLALISDEVWRDGQRLYVDLGFGEIQKIVFFERDLPATHALNSPVAQNLPNLAFGPMGANDMDELLELDHTSFPWLWWNSPDEFGQYMRTPSVYVYEASLAGTPIGYASFTLYEGWAHLDRLAVKTEFQGRGYGAAQLAYVLAKMSDLGARSVGLSTQATNSRSHRLYRSFGFRLTNDAMPFYGIKLNPDLELN